jgi:hypothetical protein
MIRIMELYMIYGHEIAVWCEATMCWNQSLQASWNEIKDGLNMFLGNLPRYSLYMPTKTLINKLFINPISVMFDG